ncbi:hypothetical protein B0H14DRAFT_2840277 [Mycena olivaceomarginata]|nr:hypothetical protein B0H14DRAFT_2840277 [Mycena olivaceomarginata]
MTSLLVLTLTSACFSSCFSRARESNPRSARRFKAFDTISAAHHTGYSLNFAAVETIFEHLIPFSGANCESGVQRT